MANASSSCRMFHRYIEDAYAKTHLWLDSFQELKGYRWKKYKEEILPLLNEASFMSAATQYHTFLPGHYFKVIHTLNESIGLTTLVDWLKLNPRLCILDVGCGAGAGSAAVIGTVLRLQEENLLVNPVNIFCLGIDPNTYAVAIYERFMRSVQKNLGTTNIIIDVDAEPEGIPHATSWIIERLEQKRREWGQPQLSHMFIMQVNVVSPLSALHKERKEKYEALRKLGSMISVLSDGHDKFGFEESLAYKSILENVAIDHMHVTTIGTNGYMLNERVCEMKEALIQTFDGYRHKTESIAEGRHRTTYINPPSSYWGRNQQPYPTKPFHISTISITNQEFRGDKDWHEVISEENLKLAWGRVRYNLLHESFVDEIEIRLFEENLDANLSEMQRQLMAYADDVAHTDDYVAYKVPKNISGARMRGLSRMEEELLSVAIIQKLGKEESQLRRNSYAYCINQGRRDTEYLYKSWFFAYRDFMSAVRSDAQKHPNGAVLSVDIKSFYTRIIQDLLIQMLPKRLNTESQRIHWLIKLLLSKKLDEHELGCGIVQGSLSSGFYANIYLTSIDTCFGADNRWEVKLHRFVDDMIFIIPEPSEGDNIENVVNEIYQTLEEELEDLGLELNKDKTEAYYNVSEFLEKIEADTEIEQLSEEYDQLISRLWILNERLRTVFANCFDDDERWWFTIEQYAKCLGFLNIYETIPTISRRIFSFLYNNRRRRKSLGKMQELVFQELPYGDKPEELSNWTQTFSTKNAEWVKQKSEFHHQICTLLRASWEEFKTMPDISDPRRQKELETRIRFSINKLCLMGFQEMVGILAEVLREHPWLMRDKTNRVIECLARQGYTSEVLALLDHYEKEPYEMSEYLRAIVLRALRYLPVFEKEHWNLLISYATNHSPVECLMATETWFCLNDIPDFLDQVSHIDEIEKVLKENGAELPSRLVKNYALLVKRYKSNEMVTEQDVNISSYKINSINDVSELFEKPEPKMIREELYSGRHKDDKDYGDASRG